MTILLHTFIKNALKINGANFLFAPIQSVYFNQLVAAGGTVNLAAPALVF
jgi:hypothetical protein